MDALLSPTPTSIEAYRYLNLVRPGPGQRYDWNLRVRGASDTRTGLGYQVAFSVPRPRQDGSLGKRRLNGFTDVHRYPDDAIIEAALRVRAHMVKHGWEER